MCVMKNCILAIFLSLGLISCHRELGNSYEDAVSWRKKASFKDYYGVFEFNKIDSTFFRYTWSSGDTLYGSYSINGNELCLTELGRSFRCNNALGRDSTLFVFYYKANSLPAVNYPIEINGFVYYTDTAGVLKNYGCTDTASDFFIHPLLMKAFRLPSSCTHAVFFLEPKQINNPDFLHYTIRSKTILSNDGYKYKKKD